MNGRDRLDLDGPWTEESAARLREFFAGRTGCSVWAWRDHIDTPEEIEAERAERRKLLEADLANAKKRLEAENKSAASSLEAVERWEAYIAILTARLVKP